MNIVADALYVVAGLFTIAACVLTLNAVFSWIDERGTFGTAMRAQGAILAWMAVALLLTSAVRLAA